MGWSMSPAIDTIFPSTTSLTSEHVSWQFRGHVLCLNALSETAAVSVAAPPPVGCEAHPSKPTKATVAEAMPISLMNCRRSYMHAMLFPFLSSSSKAIRIVQHFHNCENVKF